MRRWICKLLRGEALYTHHQGSLPVSVTTTITVAVRVFDIRKYNVTWSLRSDTSCGHALPTAAVYVVREISNEVIRSLEYFYEDEGIKRRRISQRNPSTVHNPVFLLYTLPVLQNYYYYYYYCWFLFHSMKNFLPIFL